MLLGATLTIVGVLNFLLIVALFVLLVVGLKYLFGLIGWSVPQPIWTVLGVICFLILLIWLFTGGVPVIIGGR